MKDEEKTKEQLTSELLELRLRVAELETSEDDHRQAEEELQESEERFRTLASNIPGVVYRCANDQDWTTIYMSNEIENLVGYPASDLINNKERTVTSFIHSDDRQMVYDNVQKALANKQPFEFEYRMIHKNGNIKWVHEKGCGVWGGQWRVAMA